MSSARVDGPAWVQDAVLWHVYPLGAVGAEQTGDPGAAAVHRLPQITAWLDHVLALGANGLLLGPVFASQTHGYDTVDHLRVDPRLGDDGDLDALFAAASATGVRVLLDGVFNHVGREHPAFRAVLEQGPSAPTASWFRLRWPDDVAADPSVWTPGVEPDYDDFEGHRHLVALDHTSPDVVDHVAHVMTHWLDRGAAGWRLDAAYAVPSSFWAQVSDRVRERHPDAYLLGEVIHGDYAGAVREGHLDAVTQYELWKAVWSGLNEGNLWELSHALGRHAGFLEDFTPQTFVGNHDVTRIASRLEDERHLAHALVVLLTTGGTPSVYYGDEHGFRGVKEDREGGDDAVRPALPASPDDLSPVGLPVMALHQELVGLRRRHRWLHTARPSVLQVENRRLVVASEGGPGERLLLALSLEDGPVTLEVPGATEVLAGEAHLDGGSVRLGPHGWAVLAG
ncbi:alpha-amylase family glycosyl hydrolase [Pseudokineococcus basanitobsidens]|uniref:Alpha-amylase family glycosyl hydrolase n=1 Tax=Pseudokineococcus basanitobsidens TaxID=1926649 RepID=A0ABU8RNG0_9ACTN